MADNKLLSQKSILALVVILFFLVSALGIVVYLSSVKKYQPVAVQPTVEPTITSTPELTLTPTPTPDDLKNLLLSSIQFHDSGKVLQVYASGPYSDSCKNLAAGYQGYNECIAEGLDLYDATLSLSVYEEKNKSSLFLGNINMVSYTGNSGGLFVPFAITKDDSKIILQAQMGDPGAGGGSVNYGYVTIPIKPALNGGWAGSDFSPIANWSWGGADVPFAGDFVHFYDTYGKVIYVDNVSKGPHYYAPPFQSNDGAIMFHNLVTGETKNLLEEKDTSYEITEIDEKNRILKFKSIKSTYPQGCDKEDPVSISSCANNSITDRTMVLP